MIAPEGMHMGLLFLTRMAEDTFNVTAVNPRGWRFADRPTLGAVSKLMTAQQAIEGVLGLEHLEKRSPRAQDLATTGTEHWTNPRNLDPLLWHFLSMGDPDAPTQANTSRLTPPQKGDDCVTKSVLAFVRHALHPSDYKLYKASLLTSAAQDVSAQSGSYAGLATRMNDRATSSLSGFVLMPPR
jgi:hypothetical protein